MDISPWGNESLNNCDYSSDDNSYSQQMALLKRSEDNIRNMEILHAKLHQDMQVALHDSHIKHLKDLKKAINKVFK